MTICSLLTIFIPRLLHTVASHGKFSFKKVNGRDKRLQEQYISLDTLVIAKSYFIHFYITGIFVTLYCLSNTVNEQVFILISRNINWKMLTMLLMFLFHVLRRLYECLYITNFGDSKIHVAGYLVGIIHYIAVPITLKYSAYETESINIFLYRIAVAIFIIANYSQYKFHKILFLLKMNKHFNKNKATTNKYSLPIGIGFNYVCCPHYTAEILIYFSFWLCNTSSANLLFLNIWVISNLAIVANLQYIWYTKEFGSHIKAHWKRLIPYVW